MPLEDVLVEAYLEYLAVVRNVSRHTVMAYERDLATFSAYTASALVTAEDDVVTYMQDLARDGASARTQARRLSALKGFYKFLLERGEIEYDPTRRQKGPTLPQSLPKALTAEQVQALLAGCEGAKPAALRNRLILHLLYGCGLRVSELVGLKVSDVTAAEGIVLRVVGKGEKSRLVPLGKVAAGTITAYLEMARSHFDKRGMSDWLIPGGRGEGPLTRQRVFQLVKDLGKVAGVEVAPHHLRHTFATHLLENDADLRAVQQMLGHAHLTTTQIYTKVAAQRLREVLEKHHPLSKPRKGSREAK